MLRNNFYKIILIVSLALIGVFILGLKSQEKTRTVPCQKPVRVGLVQIIEHPALDTTRRGIYDELKEQGFIADQNMVWMYESAQGNPMLALQIAQKLVGKKPDVLVGIGTTAAQALLAATRATQEPVIVSSITDPLGAKLVNNLQKPGKNVSGVSNFLDIGKQLDVLCKVMPTLKRLGYIYNPGESNSVEMLGYLSKAAQSRNIEIVTATANKTADVIPATQSLVGKVDAFFITTDNTALSAFCAIAKIALQAQTPIPVFSGDIDLVDQGALLAVGPDQYEIGRLTGKMIAKILKKEAIPSEMPVEFPTDMKIVYNQKATEAVQALLSLRL